MNACHLPATWRRRCRLSQFIQIVIILGFWLAGEAIRRAAGLPIPGAIVGLAILLALLGSKRLNIRMVRRGAQWFLAEMLLFFVPAVLAVLDHPELTGMLGLKIITVIIAGTLIVMTVTAVVVDLCYRLSVIRKGDADAAG